MNKPKHFIVLKIVGFVAVAAAIWGIVFLIMGFSNFSSNKFMIGGMLMTFGIFIAAPCLFMGFSPEISKLSTKSAKYIQKQNKEDLTEIVSTAADISRDAVTTVTKAVKDGLRDSIYCKHCGAKISSDSKFCSYCGRAQ